MLLIRPIRATDLEALLALARAAGPGMTSLPPEAAPLEAKIAHSLESFARTPAQPGDEQYVFVLERDGRVVGTCALFATVGLNRPFYSYKILKLAHTSLELNRYETVDVLQMVNEYRGASEVASLFLLPEARADRAGRFLSRSRFLFLGRFRSRFAELVMAEMRGVHEADGRTPFWEGLGRHFFDLDFIEADHLSSLGKYQFIADLMPKYPIYIRLLPPDAQAVIGQPHPHTRPAFELLVREGFRWEGCIDVFDGGPTIHCPIEQLRGVREARTAEIAAVLDRVPEHEPRQMIASTVLEHYRATSAPLIVRDDGRVDVSSDVAEALRLGVGDRLCYAEL